MSLCACVHNIFNGLYNHSTNQGTSYLTSWWRPFLFSSFSKVNENIKYKIILANHASFVYVSVLKPLRTPGLESPPLITNPTIEGQHILSYNYTAQIVSVCMDAGGTVF